MLLRLLFSTLMDADYLDTERHFDPDRSLGDVEFRDDGAALLHIPRSKTDQEAEGAVLYIGRAAAEALRVIILE